MQTYIQKYTMEQKLTIEKSLIFDIYACEHMKKWAGKDETL